MFRNFIPINLAKQRINDKYLYYVYTLHDTMYILQIHRREVESHLQAAMRLHLDLACVKLSETQKKFEETTKRLEERVNALEEHIHFSEEKCDTQKKFEETTKKLEERVNALEEHIHFSEEKCESFAWKIDGFSEVLRKAKSGEEASKESSSFYICGYKCKLQLYSNGNGVGKNTHLSIFFVIIKGEYDAMLTWPFQKKVTFTLVDQQENANDRENIVKSFTSDSKRRNFERPVKEENIGRGLAKFVSHEELQKRRYIVDDAIFIQFHITSPE